MCKFHIDEAVNIVKGIIDQDISTYAELVTDYFYSLGFKTTNQIDFLFIVNNLKPIKNILKFRRINNKGFLIGLFKKTTSDDDLDPQPWIFVIDAKEDIKKIEAPEVVKEKTEFLQSGSQKIDLTTEFKRSELVRIAEFIGETFFKVIDVTTQQSKEDVLNYIRNQKDNIPSKEVDRILQQLNDKEVIVKGAIKILSNKLYYHLIKSFLNGEYLIKTDYSRQLEKLSTDIETSILIATATHKQEKKLLETSLYLEKAVLKLSWQMIKACDLIDNQIHAEERRTVHIEIDTERRANSIFNLNVGKFIGEKEGMIYESFMESVIEMTIIDHIYRQDVKSIQQLLLLERRKEILNTLITNSLTTIKYSQEIKQALDVVSIKNNTLLYRLLVNMDKYQIDKRAIQYVVNYFRITPEDTKEKSIYHFKDIKFPNIIRVCEHKKEISEREIDNVYSESAYKVLTDVKNYNQASYQGIKRYYRLYPLYEEVKKYANLKSSQINVKELKQAFEECRDIKEENLNHTLLFKLVKLIDTKLKYLFQDFNGVEKNQKTSKLTDIEMLLGFLQRLLTRLYKYQKLFGFNETPHDIRAYFEDSFYTYKDNKVDFACKKVNDFESKESYGNISYDYHHFIDNFFIASLHITPINIGYIERFYAKYHLQYMVYADEYQNIIQEDNKEIAKKLSQLYDRISADIKQVESKTQKEFQQMRISTITLLGVLAAFIAFVTINTGLIRVVSNIYEYILFVFTFSLSIGIFAILVYKMFLREKRKTEVVQSDLPTIAQSNTKSENKHLKWFERFIILGVCILLAFAVVYFFVIAPRIKTQTHQPQTKDNINIINSIDRNNSHQHVLQPSVIDSVK